MALGNKELAEKRREKTELELKREALKVELEGHRAANDLKPEGLEEKLREATSIDEQIRAIELEIQAAPNENTGGMARMADTAVNAINPVEFRATEEYRRAYFNAIIERGLNPGEPIPTGIRAILDKGGLRTITDMNTGSVSSGATYAMPTSTLQKVEKVITEYGALFSKVTKYGIRGSSISIPIGAQGSPTNESNGTNTLAFTFTNADITQAAIVANIKIPKMMLHNGVDGLESYFVEECGKYVGTQLDNRIINGVAATHKFLGIVTAISTGVKTFTELSLSELFGMLADVKAPYVRRGAWIMDSATYYGKILPLTDAQGKPLVTEAIIMEGGVSSVEPRLLGRPIILTEEMPSAATDPIIYGDPSQYIVNQSKEFELKSDASRYADEDALLIQGTVYSGGVCMFPTSAWAYRKKA